MDFEPKLGVKLGPSWHQNRRKWGTKTISKNHQKSGDAVVRDGTRWFGVQAPKSITILEYKCPAGKSIRDTPLSGQRPGGGYMYAPPHSRYLPPALRKV